MVRMKQEKSYNCFINRGINVWAKDVSDPYFMVVDMLFVSELVTDFFLFIHSLDCWIFYGSV